MQDDNGNRRPSVGYPVWAWILGCIIIFPLFPMLIGKFIPGTRRYLGGFGVTCISVASLVVFVVAIAAAVPGEDDSGSGNGKIVPVPTSTPRATSPPTATPAPLFVQGRGDSIVECTLGRGRKVFSLTHNGSSNFAVWLHDDVGDSELLVNEIGRYSGQVTVQFGSGLFDLAPGPCIVEVKADGSWTIRISL